MWDGLLFDVYGTLEFHRRVGLVVLLLLPYHTCTEGSTSPYE